MATIIDKLTTIFDFKTDTTGLVKAEKGIEKVGKKAVETEGMLEFLKRGLEFVGIALAVDKISEWANVWDNATNKLKSTGITGQELTVTLGELSNIANESGSNIEDVTELYQQLDVTMGEMLNHSQLITMIDSLNKVFAINATDSMHSKAAMQDLARGLENQTVNWMEIKRAMMDVPALGAIVNKHFKELGTTTTEALQGGAFASKDFVKILIDANVGISKQFAGIQRTVPMAIGHLVNSFTEFFGMLRQNSGVTNFLVSAIDGVAASFDAFAKFLSTHKNTVVAIMVVLAGVFAWFARSVAVDWVIALAPVLPIIAAVTAVIAALVLVVDDVITYFKGGDSVLGKFITTIREWWGEFSKSHKAIAQVVDAIGSLFSWIGKIIARFFESGNAASLFKIILSDIINVVDTLLGALISVISFLFNFAAGLVEVALQIVEGISQAFVSVGDMLKEPLSKLWSSMTWLWDKFVGFETQWINMWINLGASIMSALKAPFEWVANKFSWLSTGLKKIGSFFGIGGDSKDDNATSGTDGTDGTDGTKMILPASKDYATKSLGAPINNSRSVANSATTITDSSQINVTVNAPVGANNEMLAKVVTDTIGAQKASYRNATLSYDSRIKR